MNKPGLFFHYILAPRQDLLINDGWIPQKEDIQQYEMEMCERARGNCLHTLPGLNLLII